MLGWEIDDNGGILEVSDGSPTKFAMIFEVQGDSKPRRTVYYVCQAARPEHEEKTKAKNAEANTEVLKVTVFPTTIGNFTGVKFTLEKSATNEAVYNAFFDAVTEPTFS